ncbi:unnamed protein product [Diatraea saccharalis]|uniref:Uncharacterized protein n=1 Tax=Diatraea saccharalis TaxID=40085 RepID=A0A9N9QXA9_9NEOP|nr:unnamed protein product [Diatraea saccharalis]
MPGSSYPCEVNRSGFYQVGLSHQPVLFRAGWKESLGLRLKVHFPCVNKKKIHTRQSRPTRIFDDGDEFYYIQDLLEILVQNVLALCVCAASAATYYAHAGSKVAVTKKVVAQPVAVQKTSPVSSGSNADATVTRFNSEVNPDSYNYVYETSNGISASASGVLKNVDKVDVLAVQGQYQYQSPDGPIEVTYVADENGFQPQGAHLPVPPPVPEAIVRSLEYIAAHPSKDQNY